MDEKRIFALIVGIDDYAEGSQLQSAVSDARSFETHLQNYLGELEGQVISLFNSMATYDNIVEKFGQLWDHPRLKYGDPVLLYFAGNGTQLSSTEAIVTTVTTATTLSQEDSNPLETIVSQLKNIINKPKNQSEIIRAEVVARLLRQTSDKKGKGGNITIILDCGLPSTSSGAHNITRHVKFGGDPELTAGSATIKSSNSVNSIRYRTSLSDHLQEYVVLQARRGQTLGEREDGFTSFLLQNLGIGRNLTCKDLEQKIRSKWSLYTRDMGRFFLQSHKPLFFPVVHQNHKTEIEDARARGITRGSLLVLHKDNKDRLGIFRVTSVEDGRANLKLLTELGDPSQDPYTRARTVFIQPEGQLKVYLPKSPKVPLDLHKDTDMWSPIIDHIIHRYDSTKHDEIKERLEKYIADLLAHTGGRHVGMEVVHRKEDADIWVHVDESRASFSMKIPGWRESEWLKLTGSVESTSQAIKRVLRSAARWLWQFDRANPDPASKQNVGLKLTRVKRDIAKKIWEEDGMIDADKEEYITSIVVMQNQPQFFGAKITNNTHDICHPYLFYFDPNNLSIKPFYPPDASLTDTPELLDSASLGAGEHCGVGYGDSIQSPFLFTLGKEKKEYGYLKVFLTPHRTCFDSMPQGSPFEGSDVAGEDEPWDPIPEAHDWITKTLTIIQSRA